jgi:hypothetical protein
VAAIVTHRLSLANGQRSTGNAHASAPIAITETATSWASVLDVLDMTCTSLDDGDIPVTDVRRFPDRMMRARGDVVSSGELRT